MRTKATPTSGRSLTSCSESSYYKVLSLAVLTNKFKGRRICGGISILAILRIFLGSCSLDYRASLSLPVSLRAYEEE